MKVKKCFFSLNAFVLAHLHQHLYINAIEFVLLLKLLTAKEIVK